MLCPVCVCADLLSHVHVCQSQCFSQGHVTYGTVLGVQRKVLMCARLNEALCPSLSPAPFDLTPTPPPFFLLLSF